MYWLCVLDSDVTFAGGLSSVFLLEFDNHTDHNRNFVLHDLYTLTGDEHLHYDRWCCALLGIFQ